jgi:hypothetical protein
MAADEYQKIWLSEGGGAATPGNVDFIFQLHHFILYCFVADFRICNLF